MIIKTDIILLVNVLAMYMLSFCTDYWMYRSYDIDQLIEQLQSMNNTEILSWDGTFAPYRYVEVTYYANGQKSCQHDTTDCTMRHLFLFTEYGNLFRECTDLLGEYRGKLDEEGVLYASRCHFYITNPHKHNAFRHNPEIRAAEMLEFGFACTGAVLAVISAVLGAYGAILAPTAIRDRFSAEMIVTISTGLFLSCLTAFSLITVIIFLVKVRLIKEYFTPHPTDNQTAQQTAAARHRTVTLGWSFFAAILCTFLTVVASYQYLLAGYQMRNRRRHVNRRHQMHFALMNSCRQDVALAVRAKMEISRTRSK